MKKLAQSVLILLIALLLSRCAHADDRPNIVLILSDDQAWTDYGFMGHPHIETPHLDKLAAQSLVFERGYVASPLCRPSLASMVTGLYPLQHGVTGNDVNGKEDRAALSKILTDAFHQHPSFIKALVESGYLAHQSGKWWEGSWKDGGFTDGMTHGDPKRKGRHGDAGLTIGREGLEPITNFIDTAIAEEKPFFVWYAPFLPHTPHNPPANHLETYKPLAKPKDVTKYYAMCTWFDETCGELLDYLDKKGVSDNTVIVYICDNGWAAASTNANDPNQKKWNSFAQRSKTSPYENGIRTPIMISWPDHIKPEHDQNFAHSVDLFPTIVSLAGITPPEDLPGVDLLDSDSKEARDQIFGVCNSSHNITIGNPDDTLQYLWCIKDQWKQLVRYPGRDTTKYIVLHEWDTAPVHLYDLSKDPHEKNDLAEQHPEIVAKLKKSIEEWHDSLKKQTVAGL